jgi:transcriptional regulator with XRE-family HTH domain
MLGKNISYLLLKSRLTQRTIASKIGVNENAIVKWKQGKTKPEDDNLKALALIFSEQLNIPLSELKEGRALYDEDLAARGLPDPMKQHVHQAQPTYQSTEIPSRETISDHELRFLSNIRRLIHGNPNIETSEISLSQILELETLANPARTFIIQMIRGLRDVHESRKEVPPKTEEGDK